MGGILFINMKWQLTAVVCLSAILTCVVAFFFTILEPSVKQTPITPETKPEQQEIVTITPEAKPEIIPDPQIPPQFVVMAFDGSYSLDMWKATRQFAENSTTQGAPVHFTYFINPVYLITAQEKALYSPPQHPVGSSAIGFAYSDNEITQRVKQMELAVSEGHEIGSHAVGHWDGSTWSADEWLSELTQFQTLVERVDPTLPKVKGFRAPELGVSEGLWPTLQSLGYRYDASTSDYTPDAWPKRNATGLWEYPIHHITFSGTNHQIQAMDYTLYFQQTGAQDTLTQGTQEWQQAHDETFQTYMDYFNHNYNGNHAPVFMANHFSLWNDGLYWEVMKDFATEVCGMQNVECTTFSALTDYLDAHGTPEL